jgi:hypothetical protein
MNVQAPKRHAEWAQAEGEAIYRTLLPRLKVDACKPGQFIAIDISSAEYVVADTRLVLMDLYKLRFGQSVGWVQRLLQLQA